MGNDSDEGSQCILTTFEKEERLIELIKQKEFIYDKQKPGYKDKLRRQNAFAEIDKALGLKAGDSLSIWARLKKQYTGYLQRIGAGKKSGSGAPSIATTFRHAGSMSFYQAFYRPYKSTTNIVEQDYAETLNTEDYELIDDEDDSESSTRILKRGNIEIECHGFGKDVPEVVIESSSTSPCFPAFKKSRKKMKSETDAFGDKLLLAIENTNKASGDEYDHWGAYLAGRLREINGKNKRYSAKLKLDIQQVITSYELKILDDEEQEQGSEDSQ